jgi:hypothetical protein
VGKTTFFLTLESDHNCIRVSKVKEPHHGACRQRVDRGPEWTNRANVCITTKLKADRGMKRISTLFFPSNSVLDNLLLTRLWSQVLSHFCKDFVLCETDLLFIAKHLFWGIDCFPPRCSNSPHLFHSDLMDLGMAKITPPSLGHRFLISDSFVQLSFKDSVTLRTIASVIPVHIVFFNAKGSRAGLQATHPKVSGLKKKIYGEIYYGLAEENTSKVDFKHPEGVCCNLSF